MCKKLFLYMKEIECRLCGNHYNIKSFGVHISRTHKMKYADYAKQYWKDLPNWSPCKKEACDNVCKSAYCSDECYRKGQSETLSGGKMPPRTKQHREKISKAAKERLSDPTNHHMYGKSHNEETLKKISESQKERLSDPTNHGMYGKSHSEESKVMMSEARLKYYETHDPPFKGKTHTPKTIKKIFENRPMNKLEERVANYLDSLNVEYHFQFFINEDGVCKSYDFKIKESDIILEIHGDYWHGGKGVDKHFFDVDKNIENDKLKKQIAARRGYEVVVIWESDINEDESIIEDKLLEHSII